jgi:protocatechuate 3,4-dioxygenase beta subunit
MRRSNLLAMDNDDHPRGRVLTRREALALLGAGGAALLAGYASRGALAAELKGDAKPVCIVKPEQTEGPYYMEARLNRSDIRSDPLDGQRREGVPLALSLRVASVVGGNCMPLTGAVVDVWQCDAAGAYSDVRDSRFNTVGKRFLRGYQVTDADGRVRFTTIYPGWYPGRAVHIHLKVRMKGPTQSHEFTSQLYFDDALTDRIHAQPPYAAKGERRTLNGEDGLYRRGGRDLMLAATETPTGLAASFDVGMKLG